MSSPDNDSTRKTMAIRVDPKIHAQLQLIAQLRGRTLGDEHLQAVLDHIDRAKDEADLAESADLALQEIDRLAAIQRDAINSLRSRSKAAPVKGATDGSSADTPAHPTRRKRSDSQSDG